LSAAGRLIVGHVVLLGDSIFDNERYVPDRPPVIEQVRGRLPAGWKATLLAVDGDIAEDVPKRLRHLPADATHLFVSAGGNNALGWGGILRDPACTVGEAMLLLAEVGAKFRGGYHEMLREVLALGKPTAVCTIYDAIPMLGDAERAGLGFFNEIILREAFAAVLPVLDLRLVCTRADDYSHLSPIEPSHLGGAKIAKLIAEVAAAHDFARGRSVVYW
jgi:hypothetical protein